MNSDPPQLTVKETSQLIDVFINKYVEPESIITDDLVTTVQFFLDEVICKFVCSKEKLENLSFDREIILKDFMIKVKHNLIYIKLII